MSPRHPIGLYPLLFTLPLVRSPFVPHTLISTFSLPSTHFHFAFLYICLHLCLSLARLMFAPLDKMVSRVLAAWAFFFFSRRVPDMPCHWWPNSARLRTLGVILLDSLRGDASYGLSDLGGSGFFWSVRRHQVFMWDVGPFLHETILTALGLLNFRFMHHICVWENPTWLYLLWWLN